jgi:hypothetical protein
MLVPNAQLQFSGAGGNRFLTVTPVNNQTGTTLVTLTVTDSALASSSTSFLLAVYAPVAVDDNYAVNEDTTLNVAPPGC